MNDFTFKEKVSFFFEVYFYEIEKDLKTRSNELIKIKFQSEEANTDEYLKRYFKEYIQKFNSIKNSEILTVEIKRGNEIISLPVDSIKDIYIKEVLLPEELSTIQKQKILETKTSVYTNPDLFLGVTSENNKDLIYESVELKSTKNNAIPGSSVQQVSPYEWVIFLKRNTDNVEVTTGKYINSITEKLPFPDRSPRPQIAFNILEEWNKTMRKVTNKRLAVIIDKEVEDQKKKLLLDWQDFLAEEWLSIVKSPSPFKNEKWFNSALRRFAIKFLDYTQTLDKEDIDNLKNDLNFLIKNYSK